MCRGCEGHRPRLAASVNERSAVRLDWSKALRISVPPRLAGGLAAPAKAAANAFFCQSTVRTTRSASLGAPRGGCHDSLASATGQRILVWDGTSPRPWDRYPLRWSEASTAPLKFLLPLTNAADPQPTIYDATGTCVATLRAPVRSLRRTARDGCPTTDAGQHPYRTREALPPSHTVAQSTPLDGGRRTPSARSGMIQRQLSLPLDLPLAHAVFSSSPCDVRSRQGRRDHGGPAGRPPGQWHHRGRLAGSPYGRAAAATCGSSTGH